MWPFRKKKASIFDDPRYRENPVYLFFEDFVLDVIGKLPPEKQQRMEGMDLKRIFKTEASEWHAALRETLALSATIDIAILDLWIRNRHLYPDDMKGYYAFAQDFTDHFMADGSKVDVWPEGALEAARERISRFKNGA